METYVVKEIREYEESILMGLNKRQLLCSILAILSAVGMYFGAGSSARRSSGGCASWWPSPLLWLGSCDSRA